MAFIPNIKQDTITYEDARFRAYLVEQGYDVDTLGTKEYKEHRQSISA